MRTLPKFMDNREDLALTRLILAAVAMHAMINDGQMVLHSTADKAFDMADKILERVPVLEKENEDPVPAPPDPTTPPYLPGDDIPF
jgi:hypothetical protein